MQYFKFTDTKINYIRTYGSPTFFAANDNDPGVKLDLSGNDIFLCTGYDLDYSVKKITNGSKSIITIMYNC